MNRITQIQDWYAAHCNGIWEHSYGIKIESLDNPGWWVKIDLSETELAHANFTAIDQKFSDADWINCQIKNQVFEGAGDSKKLESILGIFIDWARQYENQAL